MATRQRKSVVNQTTQRQRLDHLIQEQWGWSRRTIKRWASNHGVDASRFLAIGESFEIDSSDDDSEGQGVLASSVFSHPLLEIVRKPPLVHSERLLMSDGIWLQTRRPVCHRLDFESSGLLVCAENPADFRATAHVRKHYYIGVSGNLPVSQEVSGRIRRIRPDLAIFERGVDESSKTFFHGWISDGIFWVSLESGAIHQIRATCAALGFPLFGDQKYGSTLGNGRFFLHCVGVDIVWGDLKLFVRDTQWEQHRVDGL